MPTRFRPPARDPKVEALRADGALYRHADQVSDPVVQALVLTAVVISFGVSALLLAIVYRVYLSHRTVDLEELSDHDIQQLNEEAAKRALDEPSISDDDDDNGEGRP